MSCVFTKTPCTPSYDFAGPSDMIKPIKDAIATLKFVCDKLLELF